ncbi:MAG TPA: alpha/beta hydrolase [Alphaproteobacteria bacterium]|nr:alpha/beta hydrolase [Alphaproteobacteria bacterium]
MPPITTLAIEANGLTFEVLECGEGDRLVLCLHGFPSHARCWTGQFAALVEAGYRVWAPNLRGYGKSGRPPHVADYTVDTLLADIAGLIDAAGARSVTVMAHDWGGLLAWFFAARAIRPIDRLIILNAPHPACATVAYRKWRQARKGWYILAFQIPWLPDRILAARHAWAIGRLMRFASGRARVFSNVAIEFYRSQASEPGAATAMLNWYRGLTRGGVPDELKGKFPQIETPTLVIWGDADVALDRSCIAGVEVYVPNIQIRYLEGVSHWVQEQEPDTVSRMVTAFLDGRTVPLG